MWRSVRRRPSIASRSPRVVRGPTRAPLEEAVHDPAAARERPDLLRLAQFGQIHSEAQGAATKKQSTSEHFNDRDFQRAVAAGAIERGLGRGQVIDPAAGMRLDVGERLVLAQPCLFCCRGAGTVL